MPGWVTDQSLKDELTGMLGSADAAELPAAWDKVIPHAVDDAYQVVISALISRGYTIAQITAWPAGRVYQSSQALFFCCTRGRAWLGDKWDSSAVEALDRREELKTVMLHNSAGIVVSPANVIGHGSMKAVDAPSPRGDTFLDSRNDGKFRKY